jgi:hypothetical protein
MPGRPLCALPGAGVWGSWWRAEATCCGEGESTPRGEEKSVRASVAGEKLPRDKSAPSMKGGRWVPAVLGRCGERKGEERSVGGLADAGSPIDCSTFASQRPRLLLPAPDSARPLPSGLDAICVVEAHPAGVLGVLWQKEKTSSRKRLL